ncbi:MAG: TRAP transporter small permease subunit [Bernardetiaceae bacterium]
MKHLEKTIHFLEALNEWIGRGVAWLTTLLVLLFCADVFARNVLRFSSAAIFELEWHIFALIFLLGAGYTLKHDQHVRVDVFYGQFSPRLKAWINLLGTLFFLLPFCGLLIYYGTQMAQTAYQINEGSGDPGGLPARYLIKSAIPLGMFFLSLQGIALLLRSLKTLLSP